MLEKYKKSLNDIEKNYFDASGKLKWGDNEPLTVNDFDKKALEIVLPDVVITEDALNVFQEFQSTTQKQGIEVWYIIGI